MVSILLTVPLCPDAERSIKERSELPLSSCCRGARNITSNLKLSGPTGSLSSSFTIRQQHSANMDKELLLSSGYRLVIV